MMDASTPASHARPDAMDRAAGLDPSGAIFALRAERPEFLNGAESCHHSVLGPGDDLGLRPALRRAIARRVAGIAGNAALALAYDLPPDAEPELQTMAGGLTPAAPFLAAITAHADLIATTPGLSGPQHLQGLLDAGLSVTQIVALSELLGYLSFQVTVAHGLSLLDGTA